MKKYWKERKIHIFCLQVTKMAHIEYATVEDILNYFGKFFISLHFPPVQFIYFWIEQNTCFLLIYFYTQSVTIFTTLGLMTCLVLLLKPIMMYLFYWLIKYNYTVELLCTIFTLTKNARTTNCDSRQFHLVVSKSFIYCISCIIFVIDFI